MMETSQGRAALCWTAFVCALCVVTWNSRADAQTGAPGPAAASAPESSPTALSAGSSVEPTANPEVAGDVTSNEAAVNPAVPDLIYLESPAHPGKYIPVRPNATFDAFQEFLRSRSAQQQPGPKRPAYFITSLALDGTVRGETAVLKARIEVQVDRAEGDFLVPLKLNEATLLDTAYEGPGSATPDDRDRDAGYRWWFRGKGTHQLNLSLSVDLRNQVPGQRLQLSLPTTAVSFLKLRVPQSQVSVRSAPGGSRPEVRGINDEETEITLYGLGSRLDLTWQPVPEPRAVETQLQSTTSMTIGFTPDEVVLDVTQVVQAVQGRFDGLTVRLPAHFSVRKLEKGDFVMEMRDENLAVIQFNEPVAGPVELKWILNAEYDQLPDGNRRIGIYGFDLLRSRDGSVTNYQVRQQTGYIAIDAGEDYTVSKRDSDSFDVLRRSVSSLGKNREFRSAVTEGRISSAYQFLKQPFHLSLDLNPVEPYFTADPQFVLLLSDGRAELRGTLGVQINRGTVSSLELPWPGFAAENWKLEPVSSPGQVLAGEDGLRIENLPLPDANGWVQCRFKASRPLPSSAESLHTITLPRVIDTSGSPPTSTLVIADAENVKSTISAAGDTRMKAVPLPESDLPAEVRALSRVAAYRLDSLEVQLSGRVEVKPQKVAVESVVEVTLEDSQPRGRLLQIRQTISYDVDFERLEQARLLMPQQLRGLVRFFDEAGRPLVASIAGQPGDENVAVRLAFDEPKIGRFLIWAEFELPYPESAASAGTSLDIPLLQSQDQSFGQVELRWTTHAEVAASPEDASWSPESSMPDVQVWRTAQPQAAIALSFQPSDQATPRTFQATRAFLRSEILVDGRIKTVARYRLAGYVTTVGLKLPVSATAPHAFWWNEHQLSGERAKPVSVGSREYRLDLSEFDITNGGLLTIEYISESDKPLGWSDRHQVGAPKFLGQVRVGQTAWEIGFPTGQYLFASPERVSPEFGWARSFVFWSRVPYGPLANPEQWINAADGPAELTPSERTNDYPFSGYGEVASITFRSISLPMMVLLGAGTALLVGFVLLMLPATRSMLTVLAVGFVVALVGLWYAEAVQLLLQWGLLGMLLAAAAAYIDATVKSPRTASVVTMSSPSDFLPPSSSVDRPVAIGIGSEDPTLHRARLDPAVEAISSSDTGRRS